MFINSAIWERTKVNEEKIQQFFFKLQNTIKENVHIMMIKPLWKHHGIIHCTSQFDCFFILVIDREGFFSYFVFRVIFISQTLFFSKKKKKQQQRKGVIFYVLKSVALLVHFKFINIIISKTFWNCHCWFKDILSCVFLNFKSRSFSVGVSARWEYLRPALLPHCEF